MKNFISISALFFISIFLNLFSESSESTEVRFQPSVDEFVYNKHRYLCFNNSCWVHDPDCPFCQKFRGYLYMNDHDYFGHKVRDIEITRSDE